MLMFDFLANGCLPQVTGLLSHQGNEIGHSRTLNSRCLVSPCLAWEEMAVSLRTHGNMAANLMEASRTGGFGVAGKQNRSGRRR